MRMYFGRAKTTSSKDGSDGAEKKSQGIETKVNDREEKAKGRSSQIKIEIKRVKK